MTDRRALWLLWLLLFATVPLPYFAMEIGREPGLKLLAFAAATGAAAATEPSGMAAFVTGLFWLQTLAYGAVLFFVARRLRPRCRARRRWVWGLILALWLALVVSVPVYRTPFSPRGSRTSLLGLWP